MSDLICELVKETDPFLRETQRYSIKNAKKLKKT
jgi:hypothetical protein